MTSDVGETPSASLWRNRDFRMLFAAIASSKIGMQVSYLAVPLVAVVALEASAGEVGLLATLSTAAFLLIGLPAGAWLDRVRRRPVMIVANLARAALFASVPVAALLGALTIEHLYLTVLLAGAATVLFDVAHLSFLPQVVGRERLIEANSALHGFDAVVNIGGRSGAGYLVQWVTAPFALAVTAVGYLASGTFLMALRRGESAPTPSGRTLGREIGDGLRFVLGHPILRTVAIAGAGTNLGIQVIITMLPIRTVVELGLTEGVLGLLFGVGGAGALAGTLTARHLARWLGEGRMLWILGLITAPVGLAVPLLDQGAWLWAAGTAWFVVTYRIGIDNVILVSFRQRVTPDRMLGRQNATMRFLLFGALAAGSALAGLVGQLIGVQAALWVGAAILALIWVPLFFSPLRDLRKLPG